MMPPICKPNDVECLINKNKLSPLPLFMDKLSRKMTIKGCTVGLSERTDATGALLGIQNTKDIELDDVKSILRAAYSKSEHCDKVFEDSWNELLATPQMMMKGGSAGMEGLPEGMGPLVEKQLAKFIEKATEAEGMVIDEKEMEELLKEGRVQAMGKMDSDVMDKINDYIDKKMQGKGNGMPSMEGMSKEDLQQYIDDRIKSGNLANQLKKQCEDYINKGGPGGLGQCLVDINKQIAKTIEENLKSGKLSKLRKTGSEVEQMLDDVSKSINRADMSLKDKIELKEFLKDLKQFKDSLKKKIDEQIPKMDINPYFDDPEKEKQFVDQFMRGGIFNWGHPEFIGMVTNLDYFKAKIREGLKELKTRRGKKDIVRQKGKLIHPRATIMEAMRKGAMMDILFKQRPPKQKEDLVWLVDSSGSMTTAFSFIQPVVDGLSGLGIKQKFFLGTEEGLEVPPNSNFQEILNQLKTGGTVLSQAYDDIKPKVGSFKDKTFIIYSDMGDFEPESFEERLNNVVSEGGKVLLISNHPVRASPWGDKYAKNVIARDPIVEFNEVNNFDRLIEVLRQAKSIIKR